MLSSDLLPRPELHSGYNYNALKPDIQREVRSAARRIRDHLKRAVIDIGRELIAAKDILPHGTFADWVRLEFKMEPRTAQNYMAVASAFGEKCESVSYLPPTTLFALSRKSTPPLARERLLAQIEAGGRPGESEVLDIIRASKTPRPSSVPAQEVDADPECTARTPEIRDAQLDDLAANILTFIPSWTVHNLIAMLTNEGGGKRLAESLIWETNKIFADRVAARTAEIADLSTRQHRLDLPSPAIEEEPTEDEVDADDTQDFLDACGSLNRS